MKALVLSRNTKSKRSQISESTLKIQDVPDPIPSSGEALIRVRVAGVCRTDIELAKGYMDFQGIPGHEFVGEVLSLSKDVEKIHKKLIGCRVVGEINCGCGICSYCLSNLERHCPDRTVLGISKRNGAFAEMLTMPVKNLHLVPDSMDDLTAVFTEPVAAALEIFEQVNISPSDKILVIGDGKLGLLISKALQIYGCDLTCIGGNQRKLKLLKQWKINCVQHGQFQPALFDIAIEASGSPQGFSLALASLKPRGKLILKSTYEGSLTFNTAPIVINEITVIGSRCGPFEPALRLLEQELIPTIQLINDLYPIERAQEAFLRACEPDSLKILINFPN